MQSFNELSRNNSERYERAHLTLQTGIRAMRAAAARDVEAANRLGIAVWDERVTDRIHVMVSSPIRLKYRPLGDVATRLCGIINGDTQTLALETPLPEGLYQVHGAIGQIPADNRSPRTYLLGRGTSGVMESDSLQVRIENANRFNYEKLPYMQPESVQAEQLITGMQGMIEQLNS